MPHFSAEKYGMSPFPDPGAMIARHFLARISSSLARHERWNIISKSGNKNTPGFKLE